MCCLGHIVHGTMLCVNASKKLKRLTSDGVDGLHRARPVRVSTKDTQPFVPKLTFCHACYKQCVVLAPACIQAHVPPFQVLQGCDVYARYELALPMTIASRALLSLCTHDRAFKTCFKSLTHTHRNTAAKNASCLCKILPTKRNMLHCNTCQHGWMPSKACDKLPIMVVAGPKPKCRVSMYLKVLTGCWQSMA